MILICVIFIRVIFIRVIFIMTHFLMSLGQNIITFSVEVIYRIHEITRKIKRTSQVICIRSSDSEDSFLTVPFMPAMLITMIFITMILITMVLITMVLITMILITMVLITMVLIHMIIMATMLITMVITMKRNTISTTRVALRYSNVSPITCLGYTETSR